MRQTAPAQTEPRHPPYLSDYVAMAGRALYGPDWALPLAKAFDLNPRTAQRIKAAEHNGQPYPVSPSLIAAVRRHLITRAKFLTGLAETIPDFED